MAKLSIGEFLSVLRKAKGLTQESVAEQLGVSSKSVSSWENDRTCPDIMLLPVIAEFYGITVDELIRGEREVQEEPSERMKEVSQDSMRRIRKRKYASFLEKRTVYSVISLASALISVLGCYLMSFVAFWTMVFAILGLLGTATGIILSVINKKKYFAGEGIVLPEDISAENCSMVLTVGKMNLLSVVLSAIPYLIYGVIITIIRLADPNAFIYSIGSKIVSLEIDSTGFVLTVGIISLLLGLGMLAFALIYRFLLIRKFGNEEQRSMQKKNAKLSVILASIAIGILILVELIAGVYALCMNGKKTGYEGELFDDFEDFRDYMQTVSTSILYESSGLFVESGTVLDIPSELFSVHTDQSGYRYYEYVPGEYDCGNSFVIQVYDVDTKYTVEDAVINYPAFLVYRRGGVDYPVEDISGWIMMINHSSADGTGNVSDPVINVRYADYLTSYTVQNRTKTVVKTVSLYSAGNKPTSKEIYIAEYADSGKYEGKYGVFIYCELCRGWILVPLFIWLRLMCVYAIVAVILFAIKYKKQKFGFEI